MIKKTREKEEGFTLIELLVVIAILGILAGVVVFAVQGLGDKGQANACKIDTRTVRTAEEAYFSQKGTYGTMAQLANTPFVAGEPKFLDAASTLHAVVGPSATGYTLNVADAKCGAVGSPVNGTTEL